MSAVKMDKLRFSLYAWRKMCYIRDLGDTEVSFFAVSKRDQLDLVVDVRMPYQTGYSAFTEFDESRLANFFEDMVEEGFHPEEFGRIWCHTHPSNFATPSSKDEETFTNEFAAPNWAIMFILGKAKENANTSCRLKYKNHPELVHVVGSHASRELKVEIDFDADIQAINQETRDAWKAEYEQRLTKGTYQSNYQSNYAGGYTGYNYHGYQAPKPYKSWRQEAQEKVFGPGWRKNRNGYWLYTAKQFEEDTKNNITVSPDYVAQAKEGTSSSPTSEDWRNRFRSDESRKTPIGFYRPETTHTGKLTRREKKYLKKHGTLQGFVPPTPQQPVKLEKLETDRNLLAQQGDDDWLEEAADAYELSSKGEYLKRYDHIKGGYTRYEVKLDDGSVYDGVWARCEEEAVDMVMLELGMALEYFEGDVTTTMDPDTELELMPEPTDKELIDLEKEVDKIIADGEADTGLQAFSEHELAAQADSFHDMLFGT